VKKRKLAERIAKDINEHDAHQVSKWLCTPTEGTDDVVVINIVVEDTEEKELVEYRFKVTPQMVEEGVKDIKDYLLEIAGVPPSEDRSVPHLERHQAQLLLRGYQKNYKNLETYDLGANTFSYYIFPDVMRPLESKPRKALSHFCYLWILF